MEKSMMSDLESLPEEDQAKMSKLIDQHQVRDSIRMYNSLVERCFSDCVDTFYRKSLTKQEETCVRRCADKYLSHSTRVGIRFSHVSQPSSLSDSDLP